MSELFDLGNVEQVIGFTNIMTRVHDLGGDIQTVWNPEFSPSALEGATYYWQPRTDSGPAKYGFKTVQRLVVFIGGYNNAFLASSLFAGYYVLPYTNVGGYKYNPGARAHYDFAALGELADESNGGLDVLIVGYSGGSVLGMMMAERLVTTGKYKNLSLLTIGAPRSSYANWVRNSVRMSWLRLHNVGDPVEFLPPRRSESSVAENLNPALQNHAQLYGSFGKGISLTEDGSVIDHGWNFQDDSPTPVTNDLLRWVTGQSLRDGTNYHQLAVYKDRLQRLNTNHGGNPPRFFDAPSQSSSVPSTISPANPVNTPQPHLPYANNARGAAASLQEYIPPLSGNQVLPPPVPSSPKPFQAVRQKDGWYVYRWTLPVVKAKSRRDARKIASGLNRLVAVMLTSSYVDREALNAGLPG
jgi:hypothetical protein